MKDIDFKEEKETLEKLTKISDFDSWCSSEMATNVNAARISILSKIVLKMLDKLDV